VPQNRVEEKRIAALRDIARLSPIPFGDLLGVQAKRGGIAAQKAARVDLTRKLPQPAGFQSLQVNRSDP
jgi:hypothetical protein